MSRAYSTGRTTSVLCEDRKSYHGRYKVSEDLVLDQEFGIVELESRPLTSPDAMGSGGMMGSGGSGGMMGSGSMMGSGGSGT